MCDPPCDRSSSLEAWRPPLMPFASLTQEAAQEAANELTMRHISGQHPWQQTGSYVPAAEVRHARLPVTALQYIMLPARMYCL